MDVLAGDPAGPHASSSKVVLQFICSKGENAGATGKEGTKDLGLGAEFATMCAEVPLMIVEW